MPWNPAWFVRAPIAGWLLLPVIAQTSRAGLVLNDPLQGSTVGSRSGGAFVAGGWQVTGSTDTIYWHVPAITNGAAEFDVRGLYPNECRAGMEDKVELFHMYDFTFGNADTVYLGGYRDNPFKHFLRKTDCLDVARVNSMEIVWQIAPDFTEPDTAALSWDPGTTYHFREEWGTDNANNAVLKVFRDGVLILTTAVPGVWNPLGHSVRIAASPRRSPDFGAPLGAIFSQVKVWDLAAGPPAAPIITLPASNAVLNTTTVFVQWAGDPHTRYQVRISGTDDPSAPAVWDSGPVNSGRNFAWTDALPDSNTYYAFVRLASGDDWGPWNSPGRIFSVNTGLSTSAANLVRIRGKTFTDNGGPFLGLGVSYFQALRHAKYDRARLTNNLALLAAKGFNYVRVLSMVNWDGLEIAPVTFTNSVGHFVAAWPDYWQQYRDLLDLIGAHGMRAEVTVFADAQYVMPSKTTRLTHLDTLLSNSESRSTKIIHYEAANEAWQNGFPGAQGESDLREFAQYIGSRTIVPVAITSMPDTSDAGIVALYNGSAADLATVHFSRDTGTAEGGWLPVRDCYRAADLPGVPPVTSNEPIGPGSSVSTENDPVKLNAAAIFAYIAGLPAYVYHSRAGVFGYTVCCPPGGAQVPFESTAGINAYQFVRQRLPADLASWIRNDGIASDAPFTVYCNGQANKYWPDVPGATDGCDRNIGAFKGNEFVCFPMGILGAGLTLETRRAVSFKVFNPLTGAVVFSYSMGAGNRFNLPPGPGAYLIKGTVVDALNACEPWAQFLDGSIQPTIPWTAFQGAPGGITAVVNIPGPDPNQALRINSGTEENQWYIGPTTLDECALAARFRLVNFTPLGKENLLCLTTHSTPLSPAPAVTLVNGRYKLWSYVNSDLELIDLGPALTNEWHTAYLYARNDGKVRLWWDGRLLFDGHAPLVNPFDGYAEWGSGSWQHDASTTVDFDWVAYGHPCNLPQLLSAVHDGNRVVLSWPTNAHGYCLQSASNLTSAQWSMVTNVPAIVNDRFSLTNEVNGPGKFFRLSR